MKRPERILFVDDEPNVLSGLRRMLDREWTVTTACGPEEGLKTISAGPPFAVVCSDMRMPIMDGVAFIRKAREIAPQTVFLMLTGNSDQQTAMQAVNEGQVFRFINKPCDKPIIETTLAAAVEQHRLIVAEKELIHGTLKGAIVVLTDVLGMARPEMFAGAGRLAALAKLIAAELKIADAWKVEMAAMMLQLGTIALDDDLVSRAQKPDGLEPSEREAFASHAALGANVVRRIPRLAGVAEVIAHQFEPSCNAADAWLAGSLEAVHAAQCVLAAQRDGLKFSELPAALQAFKPALRPETIACVVAIGADRLGLSNNVLRSELPVAQLRSGMVLREDARSGAGELLLATGNTLSDGVIERLRAFAKRGMLKPTLVVEHLAAA